MYFLRKFIIYSKLANNTRTKLKVAICGISSSAANHVKRNKLNLYKIGKSFFLHFSVTSHLLNYVNAVRCSKGEQAPFSNTHSLSVIQKLPFFCNAITKKYTFTAQAETHCMHTTDSSEKSEHSFNVTKRSD